MIHKGGFMTFLELKKIARERGLNVDSMKRKHDVVRAIQRAEGNRDCFMSGETQTCGQTGCLWLKDCSK
jgi:hypothetical protein